MSIRLSSIPGCRQKADLLFSTLLLLLGIRSFKWELAIAVKSDNQFWGDSQL